MVSGLEAEQLRLGADPAGPAVGLAGKRGEVGEARDVDRRGDAVGDAGGLGQHRLEVRGRPARCGEPVASASSPRRQRHQRGEVRTRRLPADGDALGVDPVLLAPQPEPADRRPGVLRLRRVPVPGQQPVAHRRDGVAVPHEPAGGAVVLAAALPAAAVQPHHHGHRVLHRRAVDVHQQREAAGVGEDDVAEHRRVLPPSLQLHVAPGRRDRRCGSVGSGKIGRHGKGTTRSVKEWERKKGALWGKKPSRAFHASPRCARPSSGVRVAPSWALGRDPLSLRLLGDAAAATPVSVSIAPLDGWLRRSPAVAAHGNTNSCTSPDRPRRALPPECSSRQRPPRRVGATCRAGLWPGPTPGRVLTLSPWALPRREPRRSPPRTRTRRRRRCSRS